MSRYLYGHGSGQGGQEVDCIMPGSFSHLVQAYDDPNVAEGERNGGKMQNGDSAPLRYGQRFIFALSMVRRCCVCRWQAMEISTMQSTITMFLAFT